MLSSTSSSSQRVPALRWAPLLAGGLAICVLSVAALELRLALRGYQATAPDSPARWIRERERAGELGDRALILVGGSRIQIAADLDVLRARTGLEPVQLAIDGANSVPVFEGLAADPAIRGTIIVDFQDELLVRTGESGDRAIEWQATFERLRGRVAVPDFERVESVLTDAWRRRLRSYADGARPWDSLASRVLPADPVRQYLVMRPDRSQLADYTKVLMPEAYYGRVRRNLGQPVPVPEGTTVNEFGNELRRRVDALRPQAHLAGRYVAAVQRLAAQAAAIRARGGRVFFVMLPKSGMIRDMDERRFPRALFWEHFAAGIGAPALHFEDVPAWRGLECPDGSHLDLRQRAFFTYTLVDALGLARSVTR